MKVIILIAASLLVQVYGKPTNDQCDPQRFTICTNTFAIALGLPYMPADASVMYNQIKFLEDKGQQDKVCDAANNLQSCLGAEYSDCLSVAFFKSIGESDADATEYVAISQQLQTTCTKMCDPPLFNICTDTFAKAIGLSNFPSTANVLDNQIRQLEAQGQQNRVCGDAKNLQSCFGGEYGACISLQWFKAVGDTDADAKEFVSIFRQLESTCRLSLKSLLNCGTCDPKHFNACSDAMAKGLGLPSMPSDPNVLDKQVKQLEAQGKKGHDQVCKAGDGYYHCLGISSKSCLTPDFLKTIGYSDADVKEFLAVCQELRKLCEP